MIVNPTVNENGGFFEVITISTGSANDVCPNPQTFSIVDATGRQTTARLFNRPGTATRPAEAPSLVVTPSSFPSSGHPWDGQVFRLSENR